MDMPTCMSMHHLQALSLKARAGVDPSHWNYRWLGASVWLLGVKLRSSERAVPALNHRAITSSAALGFHERAYS